MERGRPENFPLFSRVSATHGARVTRNVRTVTVPQLTVIPPSRPVKLWVSFKDVNKSLQQYLDQGSPKRNHFFPTKVEICLPSLNFDE